MVHVNLTALGNRRICKSQIFEKQIFEHFCAIENGCESYKNAFVASCGGKYAHSIPISCYQPTFFGCYVNPSHLVISICFYGIVRYLVLIYGVIHQIRGYAACPAPVGGTTDYIIETTKLANNVGVASADNGSAISRVAVVFKSVYPPSCLIPTNSFTLVY